jgi:hypothetical protein
MVAVMILIHAPGKLSYAWSSAKLYTSYTVVGDGVTEGAALTVGRCVGNDVVGYCVGDRDMLGTGVVGTDVGAEVPLPPPHRQHISSDVKSQSS